MNEAEVNDAFEEYLKGIGDGLDDYQEEASKTAIYPSQFRVMYPTLGLVGEVGEFSNKLKKVYRDSVTLDLDDALKELGDCLWYLSAIANDLGLSLGHLATENLRKLRDRADRGVIGGSGDNR